MNASGRVELVCITKTGDHYHELPEGRRLKDAACGGFDQTKLVQISKNKAKERGYEPCGTCYGERYE